MFNFAGKQLARSALRSTNRLLSTTPARQHFLRDPFFNSPWFFDPFRPMHHRRRLVDPFAMMDHFLDDHYNFQIRDNAAKVNITEKGDLVYQVDVSGFRPEELEVSIEGEDVVIQGEHKEQTEEEAVHRQFVRRFRIPQGMQKDSIKCDIDNKGFLTVTAKKQAIEGGAERKSIPIEVKSTDAKPIGEK